MNKKEPKNRKIQWVKAGIEKPFEHFEAVQAEILEQQKSTIGPHWKQIKFGEENKILNIQRGNAPKIDGKPYTPL